MLTFSSVSPRIKKEGGGGGGEIWTAFKLLVCILHILLRVHYLLMYTPGKNGVLQEKKRGAAPSFPRLGETLFSDATVNSLLQFRYA